MTAVTDIFSNRELATLTWMVVLLVFAVWHESIHRALWQVVKAFCQPLILTALGIATLYIGGCVALMAWRELWIPDNLKTTILWAITFAFVTMFDVSRITEDKTFFAKTIRETVGVTALLLFVVEFYSFPYLVELIAIPLVTLLQMTLMVAERDDTLTPARKPVGWLLASVGFGLFGYSLYKTVNAPAGFFTIDTAREFLVPIVLSALFLPFIYVFGIYVAYERTFAPLVFTMPDRALRRYAKRRAARRFGTNLDFLKRWNRAVQIARPDDRAGVDAIFEALRAVEAREANPPVTAIEDGWSPPQAIRFLADHNLPTGDYHRSFEDEWFASAPLFGLGDDALNPCNLAYYVSGTAQAATSLKLKLCVNQPAKSAAAEAAFISHALILIERALGPGTRERLAEPVEALRPFSLSLPNGRASLAKEVWVGGLKGGYDWTLALARG